MLSGVYRYSNICSGISVINNFCFNIKCKCADHVILYKNAEDISGVELCSKSSVYPYYSIHRKTVTIIIYTDVNDKLFKQICSTKQQIT